MVSALVWLVSAALATWVSPPSAMLALAAGGFFVLPLSLPVAGAATLYRADWFYPAFMILLGAHYLPFVFLYGMRMFAALCAILVSAGLVLALYLPLPFAAGGWFTAAVLLVFALLGRWSVRAEAAAHRDVCA